MASIDYQTLAEAVAPLESTLGKASFKKFIERWSEKITSESDFELMRKALSHYAPLYERKRLRKARKTVYAYYKLVVTTRKESADQKAHAEEDKSLSSAWVVAMTRSFMDHTGSVDTLSPLGAMGFRIFMSLVSSLHKERDNLPQKRRTKRTGKNGNHGENDGEDAMGKRDPSEMSLEEQIRVFNLNPDTYF